MKQHLNTLFVMTEHAYLAKDGASVVVKVDNEPRARAPLHNLGGIVAFGSIGCSPALMAACNEAGVAITFLSTSGRFLARVVGFLPGNVLLRREQYQRTDNLEKTADIARNIVLGKITNARSVLLRAAREQNDHDVSQQLQRAASRLAQSVEELRRATNCDVIRGIEGEASRSYFEVFNHLIVNNSNDFTFNGRTRRPPMDAVNAMLSFVYSMLTHDARAACEAVGLDSQVGFLHRDRPGRPSLALDIIEEFRAFIADRVVLNVINRQQVSPNGFERSEAGGIQMNEQTRKTLITAFQKRKQDEITHPFLGEKTTVGLLIHLQARLLARFLRGDIDAYPPFISK